MAVTQQSRPIAVTSPLGEDVLLFRRMSVTEELGRLFEIRLDLYSENPEIAFDDILGQNVTVRVDQPDQQGTRYFNGYVTAFRQVGSSGRYSAYEATLRPWLWFLTRTADCRIFQEKKVPDIVKQVFRDHGLTDFQDSLSGSYRTWDYCVQYRETDFNFVSRLMEHEGIYYYFKHENGKHTLVLSDSYSAHGVMSGYDSIPYYPADQKRAREVEHIFGWLLHQEVQPGNIALNDFDFEAPNKSLRSASAAGWQHEAGQFEVYDYPGHYTVGADGDTYARVRMEELKAQHERVYGQGSTRGVAAGSLFTLSGFPRNDQNREYLVVSARHELESDVYETDSSGEEAEQYRCSFTAIDAQCPFRTARHTPKPVVQGPQTAIVVGKSGEEIWTDKYGRVKVLFHWDRYGKADENSSCWVRVAQVWSGKRWGGMAIPRIGQEVIIDFLEGDPDQPIITGRVYNGEAMPPYELPSNATRTTIKSNSSKGGAGFNELRFEDKKGEEQIFMHGEKDLDMRMKNDRREWIGHDRHLIVKNDQFDEVEKNRHTIVGGDDSTQVGGDLNLTVDGERKTDIGQSDHLAVGGDRNVKVGGDTNLKGGGAHNHELTGKFSVNSQADIHEKAGMNVAIEGGMAVHIKGGMNVVIEAGMTVTLKAGGGFVVVGPAGVAISGTPVLINSGGAAGSGSGCSPGSAAAPSAPDAPEEAKEAADDQSGEVTSAQAQPAEKKGTALGSVTVKDMQHPQARVLQQAAQDATPFCEECEKARRELEG